MGNSELSPRNLYRLPWSLADNAISWLEPTSACNLSCEGCYRKNEPNNHKSLAEVTRELALFRKMRNSDGISIAGGDPLLHPDIIEIVRIISRMGFKPVINTNGMLLSGELIKELKKAGATGFTIHIDSKQGRPKWKGKNELELNELRLAYAEMLAETGGLSCAFNSTVYEDTFSFTPDLVEWAGRHMDIVQVMVFILYRAPGPHLDFNWFADGRKITLNEIHYSEETENRVDIQSPEVVTKIRERFPEFTPCAFLNGTEKPDSFKWLLSGRIGYKDRVLGYVGSRHMETIQTMHHLLKGRYLAYCKPFFTAMGKSMMLLSAIDPEMRLIARRYLTSLLANPMKLAKNLYYQSVMIIQPVDFMANGAQNMCDGCPDVTVWNDRLVWSCRLEELKQYGCWIQSVPCRKEHTEVTALQD
jgi:hypothetical protein